MAVLTVNTPGGGVETFNDVDLDGTVGAFKTVVGVRVGMTSFQLHAYIRTGTILHLKTSLNDASLTEVGLRDGAELRVKAPGGYEKGPQAQRRLDLGTTQRATSLKRRFDKVSADVVEDGDKTRGTVDGVANQVTALQADVDVIKSAVEGHPPVRIPGELELMQQVLDTFNVARMNSLLAGFEIRHPKGTKKSGKARLLAQKAPLLELQTALLETTVAKESLGSTGLTREDEEEFNRRLVAQGAPRYSQGSLDTFVVP